MPPGETIKTRTSTVGSLSNYHRISGFTLIELVVVISIVAILLSFSFPILNQKNLGSPPEGELGTILRLVQDLKLRALEHNRQYTLHIEPGSGMLWVTHKDMSADEVQTAKDRAVILSDELSVVGVAFPETGTAVSGEYRIRFSKQGYSDFALIHFIENDSNVTMELEPFMKEIRLVEGHVSHHDCM